MRINEKKKPLNYLKAHLYVVWNVEHLVTNALTKRNIVHGKAIVHVLVIPIRRLN